MILGNAVLALSQGLTGGLAPNDAIPVISHGLLQAGIVVPAPAQLPKFLALLGPEYFLALPGSGAFGAMPGITGWVVGDNMSTELMDGKSQLAIGDRKRIPCDFGNVKQLQQGATISTFTVTCSGLIVTAQQLDYSYQLSALFDATGATAGDKTAIFTIVLNDSDATKIVRSGIIKVSA